MTGTDPQVGGRSDQPHDQELETVLAAWDDATCRLEQTHHVLREEVRRLTDELEKKNRELARKNRLADLGQIAAHVAHEVRNNLVPVTLYMSLLRRRLAQQPENLEVVTKIEAGFTALDATVNDLLHFTSQRDPQLELIDVRELILEVQGGLTPQTDSQGIEVTVDIPTGTRLLVDPQMLRRATLNLLLNAVDAMPQGGELVITGVDGPAGFELEIADSGPGLSDEVRQHVFEPFFTTKQGGTGLGLSIVCRIAEVHGGDLLAQNCPEGGSAFTLRFPKHSLQAAA